MDLSQGKYRHFGPIHQQWRVQGWGNGATAPGLTVNFWIIFALFVISRLNCKIRVPRLLCFLPVKNCSKMHQNLSFWRQKITFLGGAQSPPPHLSPLDANGTSPLLAEILHTPLFTSVTHSHLRLKVYDLLLVRHRSIALSVPFSSNFTLTNNLTLKCRPRLDITKDH